jgi:polar amino acid transport system substrate-binding protein
VDLDAETWKITSLDWQPYSGRNLSNQGKSIQKLRNLLEKKGIKLQVEFYPWKRAQHIAKKNEYVGYFPAWPEEVGKGFVASPPIDTSKLGILTRTSNNLKYENIDDLFEKYKVGIVGTYSYPEPIEKAKQRHSLQIDWSPNEISLVRKLSVGRFDVALTDPKVMLFLAEKEGISNIKVLNASVENKPLVLAFRNDPDNKKRIEILKQLLR